MQLLRLIPFCFVYTPLFLDPDLEVLQFFFIYILTCAYPVCYIFCKLTEYKITVSIFATRDN